MLPQTIFKACLIYEAKVSKLNASNLGSFDLLVERFAIPACDYRAHGHIRHMTLTYDHDGNRERPLVSALCR